MPSETKNHHKVLKHIAELAERAAPKTRLAPYPKVYETAAVLIRRKVTGQGTGSIGTVADVERALLELRSERPALFRRDPRPAPPTDIDRSWEVHGRRYTPANPWLKEHRNLDDQAFLRKHRPELARVLELEAIASTSGYAGLAKLDAWSTLSEGKRQEIASYGQADDEINPWVNGSRSQQGAMEAQNPALASMLQEEAALLSDWRQVHGNPFKDGESWNLSAQGKITREDPALAEMLREAAQLEKAELEQAAAEASARAEQARRAAEEAARKAQGLKRPSAT